MLVLQQEPSSWSRWTAALALCLLLPLVSHAADPKRNLAVAPGSPTATNEARVALVIGNSNYKSAPLKNPVNDAKAVADKLQGLGFKVTLKLDQDQKGMADAIRTFGNQLKAGGAGLFYYAGHGMQVKGRNFLIPVDADIQNEDEVPYRSIDANEVLSKMETAQNRLNLMILDACRNNPFARKFRSSSQGLAQMDAPSGTLVAFATAPGSVASDGSGKNGLYTQHLLANLGQSGLPVEQLFKRVRVGVMKDTRNAQVPWESSSLVGDFYFSSAARPGQAAAADPLAIELAYWQSIEDSTNAEDYKSYLKKYPNGQFADLAKRRALNPPKPSTTVASIPGDAARSFKTIQLQIGEQFDKVSIYPMQVCDYSRPVSSVLDDAVRRLASGKLAGVDFVGDTADATLNIQPLRVSLSRAVGQDSDYVNTIKLVVESKLSIGAQVVLTKSYEERSTSKYASCCSCGAWDSEIDSELKKVTDGLVSRMLTDIFNIRNK